MPELNQLIVNQSNQNIKNSMKNKEKSPEISLTNINFILLIFPVISLHSVAWYYLTNHIPTLNLLYLLQINQQFHHKDATASHCIL